MIRPTVLSLASSLLVSLAACGGEVSSIPSPEPSPDGGRSEREAGRDSNRETEPDVEREPTRCGIPPSFPDGGELSGCSFASCPSGTICVENDGDVGPSVPVSCVTVPAMCEGDATCACMATVAYECATNTDRPPDSGEACENASRGGRSFIVFTCLDCDGLGGAR
jgi:hypothetical protein